MASAWAPETIVWAVSRLNTFSPGAMEAKSLRLEHLGGLGPGSSRCSNPLPAPGFRGSSEQWDFCELGAPLSRPPATWKDDSR